MTQTERWSLYTPEEHADYVTRRRIIGYRAYQQGLPFSAIERAETKLPPMYYEPRIRGYVRPGAERFLGLEPK